MKSMRVWTSNLTIATAVTSALLLPLAIGKNVHAEILTVGATYSLKAAFQEFLPMFEKEHGVTVRVVYGPSQKLRRQIEKGDSNIDVFLPEATEELDILHKKGLTRSGEPRVYAQSSLVLVMSSEPQVTTTSFHYGLSNQPIRIAVADPKTSALGKSTTRMIKSLTSGYRNPLHLVHVQGPDEILNLVRMGKVDMGIVYRVDALTGGQIHIIDEATAGRGMPVNFSQAVVGSRGNESHRQAEEFFDFIMSPRIQKLLIHYGFEPMPVNQ